MLLSYRRAGEKEPVVEMDELLQLVTTRTHQAGRENWLNITLETVGPKESNTLQL